MRESRVLIIKNKKCQRPARSLLPSKNNTKQSRTNGAGGGGGGLLKERLQLEKFRAADGRARWTVQAIDEQLPFDKGFYVFIRALQLLKTHNDGVVLVGLGGASGSGKTAFSERVRSFMPGIAVISMDNYNDASKLIDGNFDDPRLTDYDLLLDNLASLRAGRAAEVCACLSAAWCWIVVMVLIVGLLLLCLFPHFATRLPKTTLMQGSQHHNQPTQ